MSPWYRTASDDFDISEFPKNFTIYGSNDGNNWYSVFVSPSQTLTAASGSGATTEATSYSITSDECYKYFGLVVTENNSGNYSVAGHGTAIGNLQFFGTPGPTTLDKGSLSLTRSLDVPRVSRYDVDTETPRPEKLLVDFDTTVNDSPTDISGRGNHGVFRESASYSPADKAFNLDGTNKNIRAELNNTETGNQYHSVSLWFKILSGQSSNWRNIFECGENPRSGTSDISLYIPGGQDKLSFTNGVVHMYSDTLTNLYFQWHHIVLTYDGANRNMYLDGALIKTLATTSWAGVANMSLTLGKNNASSAGSEGCDCHISNFKLYWQTALEPSEVKKLYNLGRTGRSMVISDTAVGIGKVPEAQLDVRGIGKFGSIYAPGTVIQAKFFEGTLNFITNLAATSGNIGIDAATGLKLSIIPRKSSSTIIGSFTTLYHYNGSTINGVRMQIWRKVGSTYTRVYGSGSHDLHYYGLNNGSMHVYISLNFHDNPNEEGVEVEYEMRAELYHTPQPSEKRLYLGNNGNQPSSVQLLEIGGE